MKRKINNSLMGTATLAIVTTLLLTVAVCYHLLKNQIWEDLKAMALLSGASVKKSSWKRFTCSLASTGRFCSKS